MLLSVTDISLPPEPTVTNTVAPEALTDELIILSVPSAGTEDPNTGPLIFTLTVPPPVEAFNVILPATTFTPVLK